MATPSAQPPSASPMTRSSTISTTWAHPTPGEDPESSLVAAVEGACNEIIYTVGAKGFLQERFGSAERATPFARWMLEKFPMRQDVLYQLDDQVPHMIEDEIGGERPIALHPCYFSFSEDCSVKPSPEMDTSRRLVEEILHHGFITSSEPVLAFKMEKPWPPTAKDDYHKNILEQVAPGSTLHLPKVIEPFSFGQIKGQARCINLLLVLSVLFEDAPDLDFVEHLPKLHASVNTIWSFAVQCGTQQDRMFMNFTISHRSAIRRAPHVVMWVQTLLKLNLQGKGEFANIVKAWNCNASKGNQLVGSKAVAVKALMEDTPEEVLHMICKHVSRWGWGACAYSDDCLGLKKGLPGTKTKHQSGITINHTAESMLLRFKLINKEWEDRLSHQRRKLTKHDMEERAEWSGMIIYLRDEALRTTALNKDEVNAALLKEFADNNTQLILELQGAMITKTTVDQISLIKEMLMTRSALSSNSAEVERQRDLTDSLQVCNFTVAMKQLESDAKAVCIYHQKQSSYESAVYWRELDWRKDQYNFYESKALKFFQDHVELWDITGKHTDLIRKITSFKQKAASTNSKHSSDVSTVAFLNWSTTCSIKMADMRTQATMMGFMGGSDETNTIGEL